MSPADESAEFARLVHALRPYRGDLVLIGGWAHRLSRLHPLAQPLEFPPLFTQDVDLAIAKGVIPEEDDLRKLLLEVGFTERFLCEDESPITHYQLGEEGAFYVEFVTPLIGRPGAATSTVAGVTAQRVRYVDILLIAPWSILLTEPQYPVGARAVEVRIANATSYVAQKLLVLGRRHPADRAKDVLYLHDTLVTFGRALEDLRRIRAESISGALHANAKRALRATAREVSSPTLDAVRAAARVAEQAGRPLPPEEIAEVCTKGPASYVPSAPPGSATSTTASALHGLAECQIPALAWMVELHRLRIEPLRIKPAATKPPKGALVLLVCGVAHHGHEVLVPTDATAVLRWTGPLAREAARIPYALLARHDRLESHLVFPAVSEVVLVPGRGTRAAKVAGDGDLPSRQGGLVPLEGILIWNADLRHVARAWPVHAKKVQVVVEPTHGILDGDMQVPEAVGPRHLDGPPDRRRYLQKDDSELVDFTPSLHALFSAAGHRTQCSGA